MVKDYVTTGSLGRPVRMKVYSVKNPRAVMVIVHGMQEHSGRYEKIAREFNDHGIVVVTSDLRGHGANILNDSPGFDDGDIFLNIVEDQIAIIGLMRKTYAGVPLVVLGHSYGSFVTQRLIRNRADVDKFILSGSSFMKGALIGAGKLVAKLTALIKGKGADANLVESLSIRGYGKNFKNRNWLTRDEKVWEDYCLDPLCGKVFPASFYVSMFSNLPKNYNKLKNSVGYKPEIFILSGDHDPVGGFGKGVRRLAKEYEACGFDVKTKLYLDGRHEMLNEINREEVILDILNFIN